MFPDDDEFEFVGPDRGWNYEPARAELFQQFRSPVYTTDAHGWLTYYNDAAAELWGYRPELGKTRWCGSWRIFTTEGAPLPLDQCPMAVAIKEGRSVRGVRAVLERPDGTRIPFMPYPTPLRDASGNLFAASNVLLEITSLNGSDPVDPSSDQWAEPMREGGADLYDLTGALQATLAALADVEFGYQIDCERLEGWSGPVEEKNRILNQLEQRRQSQRDTLNRRVEQLQQRAREIMARGRSDALLRTAAALTDNGSVH
ncbi:PAS domain-containing protein [Methylobacterium phyllosphaerae]